MAREERRLPDGTLDHPDLPIKPPFVFLIATGVGAIAHQLVGQTIRPAGMAWIGQAVLLAALCWIAFVIWTFRRHQTAVEPWKATKTIIATGPFALSRNPIYIGFAIAQVGIALWADSLTILLMILPAVVFTDRAIIRREEAYLTRKFGAPYLAYCRKVRRWL
jgi:protein-S-isoprenylcysteine O-methyltransferase Ste14